MTYEELIQDISEKEGVDLEVARKMAERLDTRKMLDETQEYVRSGVMDGSIKGTQESLFKLSSDSFSTPDAARPSGDEVIESKTVSELLPEADKIIEEMKEEASIRNAKDDGSLDFMDKTPVTQGMASAPEMMEIQERSKVKPIRLHEDAELDQVIASGESHPNYENAWNERLLRERWNSRSFWENTRDLDWWNRKGDRVVRQLGSSIPRIPGDLATLGGAVSAGGELIAEGLGAEKDPKASALTETLLNAGAEYNQMINESLGISDPENPLETLAMIGPAAIIPIAAAAKVKGPLLNTIEYLTPFTIGGGKARAGVNVGAQFAGSELLRPIIADPSDPYETIFQQFLSPGVAEAEKSNPELDFEVGRGPDGQIFRDSDRRKLGIIGLATVGLGAGPHLVRQFWSKKALPTSKLVDDTGLTAPKGLQSVEKWQDLYKAYVTSPVEALRGIFERVGVDTKGLFDAVETNVNSALRQKISAGLEVGIMRSTDGDYLSKISASRLRRGVEALAKPMKQAFNRYTMLMDMMDDYKIYGVNLLNGVTKRAATQELNNLRKQFPDVVKLHDMHVELRSADLNYASSGEWAIFSAKKAAELRKSRRNYVAYELEDVDPSLDIGTRVARQSNIYGARNSADPETIPFAMRRGPHLEARARVNASDLLEQSTENILRAKTLNAIRGQLIDALRHKSMMGHNTGTGTNLAVQITAKQLNDNPKWRDRSITVYRKGKPEHYVLSQGLADMIRFDPNFAKHQIMFGMGRTFQFFTTGAGAPWFAIKHFLRDTLVTNQLAPTGTRGVGFIKSLSAVQKQLKAQADRAYANWIYRSLDSGNGKMLRAFFNNDEQYMRGVADTIATSYTNSLHHLLTSEGGLNVNMARNAYRQARTSMDEVMRDAQAPGWVRASAGAWKNIIDAIQNAPHYAWFELNKGSMEKKLGRSLNKKEIESLVSMERPLTGNVTEAGKVYTRSGRQIGTNVQGGDITNPNVLLPFLYKGGRFLQAVREISPWTNAMIAGLRRTGVSYWSDPVRFMSRAYTYYLIPQTLSYFLTAQMGEEYLEYMMTGRSEYDKSTSIYIPPLLGGKPEDGIELPIALEIAPLPYIYLNLLDYTFRNGGSEISTVSITILDNFFGITMPPPVQALAGVALGEKLPSNISLGGFEGAYKPRENPYAALPQNLEMGIRALMGGSAEIYASGLNAFMEEGDVGAGIKEMWYKTKQRTPLIQKKQLSTFTDLNEKYYERFEKLNLLKSIRSAYAFGEGGEVIDKGLVGKPGADQPIYGFPDETNLIADMQPKLTKKGTPRKSGQMEEVPGQEKEPMLGPLRRDRIGLNPILPPTNPIYIALADEIHNMFEKRSHNYGKMVDRLGIVTKQVQALKFYNEGNLHKFREIVEALEGDEEGVMRPTKEELLQLDLNDRDSVRQAINGCEKERIRILKLMETYVKEAEDQLTQELVDSGQMEPGERVSLDKLDPYASPQE